MTKILLKNSNKVAILLIFIQIIFSQTKDMVITKEDGSKSYISVGAVDNITFNAEQTGTVTDVDGNTYNTVKIGNQWWMAENLKVKHYRGGSEIPIMTEEEELRRLRLGSYCAYNNDFGNESDTYGYLYNWYAAIRSDLAPEGWHVPTDEEWQELEDYLTNNGYSGTEGTALKSTSGWDDGGNGTDDFGFTGLPAGRYDGLGDFKSKGNFAYFWSVSEDVPNGAWFRGLAYHSSPLYRGVHARFRWFSVRCVRD